MWVERHPAPLVTPQQKETPMAESVVDPQVAKATATIVAAKATILALQAQLADTNKTLADTLAAKTQLASAADDLAALVANITVK